MTDRLSSLPRGLSARLDRSDSYHTMGLMLVNESVVSRLVDVTGTVLKTRDPRYQRVVVVGTMPSRRFVRVPSRGSVKVVLATCCMDKDMRVPDLATDYEVTTDEAPGRVMEAARGWVAQTSGMAYTAIPRDEQEAVDPMARLRQVQGACWGILGPGVKTGSKA